MPVARSAYLASSVFPVAVALVAFPFLCPLVAGPSANVWQLLAGWACAAGLALWLPGGRPSRGLTLWLAVAAAAVAVAPAGDPALRLGAITALGAVWLAACAGAAMASAPAHGARSLTAALAWGVLVAGALSAVLGLLQYYDRAHWLAPWTTSPGLGIAFGNLRQRNQFATLICMATIALLWIHGSLTSRQRIALGPVALLLLLAVVASTSRNGLLQWTLISAASAWMAWRERRACRNSASTAATDASRAGAADAVRAPAFRLPSPWLLLAMVPCYFAAASLLPLLAGPEVEGMLRRLRDGAPDGNSRLVLWRNVLELIALQPWHGWGWGELNFAHYSHLYDGPRFVEILDNAHNLPLHLAVELGVPAAVLICGGFVRLVWAAPPWRERDPARLLAWGVLGSMVLHSLLEYPLWYGPFQLVFGLCLGVLWPRPAAPPQRAARGVRAAAAPAAVAVALLLGVGYTAFDYLRISQLYLSRDDRLPAWRDDTAAKLQASWLFASQVRFATLTLSPVDRSNAAAIHAQALQTMHFSPEPRVITKLIDSAALLGRNDEALAQAERFRRAFPDDYARWLGGHPAEEPAD